MTDNHPLVGRDVNWRGDAPTRDQVMRARAFSDVHGYRPVQCMADMWPHECSACSAHIEGQLLALDAHGNTEGAAEWKRITHELDGTSTEDTGYLWPYVLRIGKIVHREDLPDGRGYRVTRERWDIYVRESIDAVALTVHYRQVHRGDPVDAHPLEGAAA